MGKWLSKAAVLWVLDEAPDVPPRLVSTLIAVARYTGTDGRGARAAASEIARCTRKSERQVQRDLAELEQLGLLRRGDPRLAAHIPANFRPNVYDLPLDTSPTSYQTGVLDTTPVTVRYDTQSPNGASPMSYDQSQKSSGTARASRARAGGARAGAPKPDPRSLVERGWPFGKPHCTDPDCIYLWPDGPNRPCPNHTHRAPPCPECGKPFSHEQLADPDFRAMALAGEAIHSECAGKDHRRYVAGASIAQLLEDGYYDEAVARDADAVARILGEAGTSP